MRYGRFRRYRNSSRFSSHFARHRKSGHSKGFKIESFNSDSYGMQYAAYRLSDGRQIGYHHGSKEAAVAEAIKKGY